MPEIDQWCQLDCGCITSVMFAWHKLGEGKVWYQTCESTREERRIIKWDIRYWQDGGNCTASARLF